jgi:hypothetical protein
LVLDSLATGAFVVGARVSISFATGVFVIGARLILALVSNFVLALSFSFPRL